MSKFAGLALPVEKPRRMTIRHPVTGQPIKDGAGQEGYIEIYSADSEQARAYEREAARTRLSAPAGMKLTPEEIESRTLDALVALTADWRLVSLSGAGLDVPFSKANARELYAEPGMLWLRRQVDAFAVDLANFAQASSQN